jgi:hypothetical protein
VWAFECPAPTEKASTETFETFALVGFTFEESIRRLALVGLTFEESIQRLTPNGNDPIGTVER